MSRCPGAGDTLSFVLQVRLVLQLHLSSREQEVLFSVVEELGEELMLSSPLRPMEQMFEAVPAPAQHENQQMPDFRNAEGNLPGRRFFSLRRAAR